MIVSYVGVPKYQRPRRGGSLTVLHLPADVGVADCNVCTGLSFIWMSSDERTPLTPEETEDTEGEEVCSRAAGMDGGDVDDGGAGISLLYDGCASLLDGIIGIDGIGIGGIGIEDDSPGA